MKALSLRLFRSNSEIRDKHRSISALRSSTDTRSLVKIGVIDDETFKPQFGLEQYGYRFTLLGDLREIRQVAPFQLILCDIIGVGKNFDRSRQGASIISEIKNNYPDKIVAAYTGNATTDPSVRMAAERADAIINKDVDNEEWVERLDTLAKAATDPFLVWERVRTRLVNLEVDTKDVLLLEDAYVRSVTGGFGTGSTLERVAQYGGVREDAKSIALNLVASGIFAFITGGS